MTRRQLSVAVGDYHHVRELVDGRVSVPGLDLICVQPQIEQILQRGFHRQEWDVCELSLAQYVAMRSRGDTRFTAIPVFPSRVFRHGSVFVGDGTLAEPQDLVGRRVGVPEWVQTAGVWTRGLLVDAYGVDARSIDWVQAGLKEPGRKEGMVVALPPGISVTGRPDTTLTEMLSSGEIDAVISARPPGQIGDRPVRCLFADPRAAEADWAQATGIFPIMHVVAMRDEVYQRDRWIAQGLLQGFTEAKRRAIDALADPTISVIALPWVADHLAMASQLLGGGEWWPYGVEPNRHTLETFLTYARAQGIAGEHVTVDELFAEETLDEVRV